MTRISRTREKNKRIRKELDELKKRMNDMLEKELVKIVN